MKIKHVKFNFHGRVEHFVNQAPCNFSIDDSLIYHFGASLKDLGKKWFAFSKMDIGAVEMLGKLEKLPQVKIDG